MTKPKFTIANIKEFLSKYITNKTWTGQIFDSRTMTHRELNMEDFKSTPFLTFVFKDKENCINEQDVSISNDKFVTYNDIRDVFSSTVSQEIDRDLSMQWKLFITNKLYANNCTEEKNKLKFTNINDIIQFLELVGFIWPGKIKVENKIVKATIEDFKDFVCLEVYDNFNTPAKYVNTYITDTTFELERLSIVKKYNFENYTAPWQKFMLERKDKEYAKAIYLKTSKERNAKEKILNEEINLISKRTEELKYKKNLEMAMYNTQIANAEIKLSKEEIDELNKLL